MGTQLGLDRIAVSKSNHDLQTRAPILLATSRRSSELSEPLPELPKIRSSEELESGVARVRVRRRYDMAMKSMFLLETIMVAGRSSCV